jgi:HEPN domain-containing protein
VKRKDLQELAALRLKDAKLLLKGNCPEGAYYLAGYAAECALKACIAKRTERFEFPDKTRVDKSWTHSLLGLVQTAELDKKLVDAREQQPELDANWTIVSEWKPKCRYERRSSAQAEALIEALEDRRYGVLRWLKHHW